MSGNDQAGPLVLNLVAVHDLIDGDSTLAKGWVQLCHYLNIIPDEDLCEVSVGRPFAHHPSELEGVDGWAIRGFLLGYLWAQEHPVLRFGRFFSVRSFALFLVGYMQKLSSSQPASKGRKACLSGSGLDTSVGVSWEDFFSHLGEWSIFPNIPYL